MSGLVVFLLTLQKCFLGYLAGTPDGVVGDTCLVEVGSIVYQFLNGAMEQWNNGTMHNAYNEQLKFLAVVCA